MQNVNPILEKLQSIRAGSFVRLAWRRQLSTLKSAGNVSAEKASSCVVRLGVNYDNISTVQAKRENGELPAENQGLKGKEWVQFPLILRSVKSGGLLVRVSTVPGQLPATTYFLNGKEVTKDDARPVCLASEFPERDEPPVTFDLALDRLTELEVVNL